jgi:membrane-bound lytic murein transglycosylase D
MTLQGVKNSRIDKEADWFASQPEYIERTFSRAAPYLHYIVNEVEARGMPMELALLPVIESAFQPYAYSRARATGLWQFMSVTGGLVVRRPARRGGGHPGRARLPAVPARHVRR